MPQYADLTQAEQDQIDELLTLVRPLAAELYRFAQKNRIPLQLWFSNPPGSGSTLADIVNGLDAAAPLPNRTALAGADAVSKEGLQSVMGYVSTIAAHDSAAHLNNLLPFAGSTNFLS
jgi:hypothetical protein